MKKPSHKLTEKQLTLLSGGIGVVVFIALCGLIFWAVSTAGTLQAEIRQLDVTRADLERKERDLPRLEREIASLQVEVERSVRILPNEKEIADLIKNLGSIRAQTAENGLTIKIKKFQPEQEKRLPGMVEDDADSEARFTPYPYVVEAQGNYYHLGRFINLLENHIRFIKVESYEMLNPKGDDAWSRPEKDITIKIVTYTYNPGQGETVERSDRPKIDWKEALEGGFVFERRNRRDPFKVPLLSRSGASGDDRTPLTRKQQQDLVTRAGRLYKELELLLRTKQVDAALKKFLDIEEIKGRRFTDPEYFKRVQKIYLDAVDLTKDIQDQAARQAVNRAEAVLKKMRRAFKDGDYKRLRSLSEQIRPLLSAQSDSPEVNARLGKYADEVNELKRRSEIRIEFYEADIRITGIYGGSLRSTVIFNGSKYGEEGMEVEVAGVKFLIKKIDSANAAATVVYKGEELELTQGEERRRIWRLPEEDKKGRKAPESDTDADAHEKEKSGESESGGGALPPLQG